jgi:hypothetical protein
MALPKQIKRLVERTLGAFCETKVLHHTVERARVIYRIQDDTVWLCEQRSFPFDAEEWEQCKVAQFKYDPSTGQWTLYFADSSSHWQEYPEAEPTEDFEALLREVDKDPDGVFWG